MIIASRNGHVEVVRALVEAGASVDQARNDGVTPLCIASEEGHVEVVRVLVAAGASVDQANNDRVTPLLMLSLIHI